MLADVHWQAGDRPLPAPKVTVAGESALLVDPAEIPSSSDVVSGPGGAGRADRINHAGGPVTERRHGKIQDRKNRLDAKPVPVQVNELD